MSTEEFLQRLARNSSELLQELRVTQAGVQILSACLLAVAFTGTTSCARPTCSRWR